LAIGANYLTSGVSYVFSLTVTSTVNGISSSVTSSTPPVLVAPSALIVSVRGGDRSISIDQSLEVDGSASYDPDDPMISPAFLWQCFNATDTAGDTATWGGCSLPAAVVLSSPWLRIPSLTLKANTRYAFRLQLDPSGPRQVISGLIYITASAVPDYPNPVVTIQSSSPTIVNAGSNLRLPALATSSAPAPSFEYIWTELSQGLDLSDLSVRGSALGAANLVVRSSALTAGMTYR
jgi:hypothetical protein